MAICKVGQILAAAEPRETMALISALRDSRWSAKALSRAVGRTRFSVGATTIKEHRRQTCGCFDE